jgi:hypothetical protein
MDALGMLALGLFIGSVVTIGIQATRDWSNLAKVLSTIFSAALAGTVFTFIEFLGGSKLGNALFYYPVGLLLGLMWGYARAALANVQAEHGNARTLGWLHLAGLFGCTLVVIALLFSPSLRGKLPNASDHSQAPNRAETSSTRPGG